MKIIFLNRIFNNIIRYHSNFKHRFPSKMIKFFNLHFTHACIFWYNEKFSTNNLSSVQYNYPTQSLNGLIFSRKSKKNNTGISNKFITDYVSLSVYTYVRTLTTVLFINYIILMGEGRMLQYCTLQYHTSTCTVQRKKIQNNVHNVFQME